MSKIITDKCEITFAALKLVEQLYTLQYTRMLKEFSQVRICV